MKISIIAAMADNRVIGSKNKLPWKLPADMQWFRQHTLGKPVVMGRKTFVSLGSKALPNRANIIVTNQRPFKASGCTVVSSIKDAVAAAGEVEEVMIIGGANFYQQMLPLTDKMYLTLIHKIVEGDSWFPEIDYTQWTETSRIDCSADEKNPLEYSFVILDRKH